MSSSCLIWTSCQAGYWGSHFPSVSLIDSLPSASSCSRITAVKALVLLPICHSARVDTGQPLPKRVVPVARSMLGLLPGKLTRSETRGDVLGLALGRQVLANVVAQR